MGNLVCAAAGTNFFAALLHDAQGRLSRLAEKRAKVAMRASRFEANSAGARAAEAVDKELEQRIKRLETLIQLLKGLQESHEKLRDEVCKDAAPKFSASA